MWLRFRHDFQCAVFGNCIRTGSSQSPHALLSASRAARDSSIKLAHEGAFVEDGLRATFRDRKPGDAAQGIREIAAQD